MTTPWLVRHVPVLGKPVHRLGLAASFGLSEAEIEEAFELGLNYVFWNASARRLTRVLRRLPADKRDRLVISTGPTLGYFGGSLRRRCEKALSILKADRLDVLQLMWLGTTSALNDSTVDELVKLKAEGKVGAIGCSIHDRPRAGKLAEDSALDLFMIRYNAAHPGAERDIFPHLERRKPAVVAYTATSWRKLLKRPRGWQGKVPTAGDCYRFCLSSPHVDVVLNGPADASELKANLAAVEQGPLDEAQLAEMRAFGQAVHG